LTQARGLPLSLVGPVETLPQLLTEAGVDTVLFALTDAAGEPEAAAIEGCLATSADVYAVPANFPPAEAHARHPRELVGGVALVHVYRRPAWAPVRAGQRVTELLVTLLALSVVLPLAAVIAVLTWLENGGVLVSHPQPDRGGVPAEVPRFRTRRARSLGRPGTTWSVAISGRSGPIGRVLRRTRLDRLPELVQVLLRRLAHPWTSGARPLGSATSARGDQPQIDARQLLA